MKKIAALTLVIAMTLSTAVPIAFAEEICSVEINGAMVEFKDAEPAVVEGKVMLPLSYVAEGLGLSYEYSFKSGVARVERGDFFAEIAEGSNELTYSAGDAELTVKMDAEAVLENECLLCPKSGVELIARQLGFNVLPDDVNGTMVITSKGAVKAVVGGIGVAYMGCAPAIADGAAMFPVSFLAEAMGLGFSWYPQRNRGVITDGTRRVELNVGQSVIRFGSSVFTADRSIMLNGGRMYASGAALRRLAVYFGFGAEFDGRTLVVTPKNEFTVSVNGEILDLRESPPVYWNERYYVPLKNVVDAMGLSYSLYEESRTAEILDKHIGKYAVIGIEDNRIGFAKGSVETDEKAEMLNGQFYVSADTLFKLAGHFGGAGSFNKYLNGIIISLKQPYVVTVNGVIVNFPDVQPEKGEYTALPLRFAAEAMGLEFLWNSEGQFAKISDESGKSVILACGGQEFQRMENGQETGSMEMDSAAYLKDERLMVTIGTLGNIAEFFGMDVTAGASVMDIVNESIVYEPSFQDEQEEEELRAELDGAVIEFPDAKPCIVDDRTLFPIRAIVESMGMEAQWDQEERKVTVKRGADSLVLEIDSREIGGVVNGVEAAALLDVPPVIIEDRTFIPIRAVMEFFGAKVEWDEEARVVRITSPRQITTVVSKKVDSAAAFADTLGFIIDAPSGAADVEYSIVDGNTARVKYRVENVDYYFSASAVNQSVFISSDEFSGPRINRKAEAGGASITVSAGELADIASASQWEVGAYKFSLRASRVVSRQAFFAESVTAANTFKIIREAELEKEPDIVWSPGLPSVTVTVSKEFETLGIIMDAPTDSKQRIYKIIDGKIAEISFSVNGINYVLRGAKTMGDLSGITEEYTGSYEVYRAVSFEEGTAVTARRTASGKRTAMWKWGEYSFCLVCTDASASALEFRRVSETCAAASYFNKE